MPLCCRSLQNYNELRQKVTTNAVHDTKYIPELTFGSREGHFFFKILESGALQKAWSPHGFRDILDVMVAPFADYKRKTHVLKSCCQFCSCFGGAKERKKWPLGDPGLPKDTKSYPK